MLTESRVSVHELGCSRLLPSSVGVCRPEPLPLPLRRVLLRSTSARAVLLAAAAAAYCSPHQSSAIFMSRRAKRTHQTSVQPSRSERIHAPSQRSGGSGPVPVQTSGPNGLHSVLPQRSHRPEQLQKICADLSASLGCFLRGVLNHAPAGLRLRPRHPSGAQLRFPGIPLLVLPRRRSHECHR